MPLELSFHKPALPIVPDVWRLPLLRLALAWTALIALLWGEWVDMVHQWWNASTYNHILLIPPILVWLVHLRRDELARLAPQAWWPGLAWLAPGLLAWLAGSLTDVNLVRQVGAVMLLQAAVPALLGPRIAFGLLFPLAYMFFLVPFGDEIIPALQAITAQLAIALTHASGVPAQIDGFFIDTPAGLFEVAEACSGVKFLVAMVALGTLVAHLCFSSSRRRAVFMAAAVIVPILANGVRAWGTIFVAQSQGLEFAAGFDHIVYGWIFFALVIAVLLGASWRFFDRSPDDPLVDVGELRSSPSLAGLEAFAIGGWRALVVLLILTAGTVAWMDRVAGVP
jgi:exosortase A